MISIFFSYSHRDEEYRNELETHLAMLKRQGIVSTWHDRRIGAGKNVDSEVSEHLESADVMLLLVSPYFLASPYCYDVEMTRALERHNANEARVIPAIVHPCDWHHAPFGKLRASPPDGKPISKFPNMHDAYLAIVTDIRQAAEELGGESRPADEMLRQPQTVPRRFSRGVRSGNLRVKKEFTDREKDEFLEAAYEYLANFFENSLGELQDRNPQIETRFRRIDQAHFSASIYVRGAKRSACRIWLGGRESLPGGIGYSANDSGGDNSFNEALSVTDDGYALLLKPLGLAIGSGSPHDNLTQHGGAEYLWSLFIRLLQ